MSLAVPPVAEPAATEFDELMPEISRPIFLQGPGRSGSSLINTLLTLHPDVGYFTTWSAALPKLPILAAAAKFRVPAIEHKHTKLKWYPRPTESYWPWLRHFPNFWRKAEDPSVDAEAAAAFQKLVKGHLWAQRSSRFVAKTTGPPMFEWLRGMFPDCKLVWLDRDPRAVTYSFYTLGWIGVGKAKVASMSAEERLTAAARRFLRLQGQLLQQQQSHYRMQYEDFVDDPLGEWRKLLDYLELRHDAAYERVITEWPIHRRAKEKWREKLPAHMQQILLAELAPALHDESPQRAMGAASGSRL